VNGARSTPGVRVAGLIRRTVGWGIAIMTRWWLGVAVVAGCLCRPALAQNPQPSIPTPYGAARTPPEPLPIGACPEPVPVQNLVPGPLTPDKAPYGPPDCLSLSPSATGAFQCETFPTEIAVFFDAGFQALQRQKLGKGAIAFQDTANTTPLEKVGRVALPNSFPAQEFNDITPNMAFGPRLTLGLLAGTDIIEVTGYFIPNNSKATEFDDPGRIFVPFVNPPAGFGGDNGLFTQVDRISTTLQNQIGNVELNYRYSDVAVNGMELILGVRYFDVRERLSTLVDQNGITSPLDPNLHKSNPVDVADYTAASHNRLLAPQLGFEGNWGLCSWLSMGVLGKGAWGANFVSDSHSLFRGDGLFGFQTERSSVIFSQMYEIGAFAELHLTERMRLRAGYNALWILHVDAVVDQYNFDLSQPEGRIDHNGSILYHGPMFEMQFLF
jgi:hypothetical protein